MFMFQYDTYGFNGFMCKCIEEQLDPNKTNQCPALYSGAIDKGLFAVFTRLDTKAGRFTIKYSMLYKSET